MPETSSWSMNKECPRVERSSTTSPTRSIEEFMLKANELAAIELSEAGKTLIYRIHEQPTEEHLKISSICPLLRSSRFLPNPPSRLPSTVSGSKKTPHFPQLSIAFIRSMRLAHIPPTTSATTALPLNTTAISPAPSAATPTSSSSACSSTNCPKRSISRRRP